MSRAAEHAAYDACDNDGLLAQCIQPNVVAEVERDLTSDTANVEIVAEWAMENLAIYETSHEDSVDQWARGGYDEPRTVPS